MESSNLDLYTHLWSLHVNATTIITKQLWVNGRFKNQDSWRVCVMLKCHVLWKFIFVRCKKLVLKTLPSANSAQFFTKSKKFSSNFLFLHRKALHQTTTILYPQKNWTLFTTRSNPRRFTKCPKGTFGFSWGFIGYKEAIAPLKQGFSRWEISTGGDLGHFGAYQCIIASNSIMVHKWGMVGPKNLQNWGFWLANIPKNFNKPNVIFSHFWGFKPGNPKKFVKGTQKVFEKWKIIGPSL